MFFYFIKRVPYQKGFEIKILGKVFSLYHAPILSHEKLDIFFSSHPLGTLLWTS